MLWRAALWSGRWPAARLGGVLGEETVSRPAAEFSMLFNEVGFLDRFDAAARAGFAGVEFLFPYEHPAALLQGRLAANGLRQALFNTPPAIGQAASVTFATARGPGAISPGASLTACGVVRTRPLASGESRGFPEKSQIDCSLL